jgi:hypothetical protein
MSFIHYTVNFFAGLFICNCIPHLASGLRGEPFPTPFARPRGVGDSSPLVNFLWGALNLFIGGALISSFPIFVGFNWSSACFIVGFLLLGILNSHHFATVRKNKRDN